MKRKTIAGLIAIVAIVTAAMFAGCANKEDVPEAMPTIIPTSPTPALSPTPVVTRSPSLSQLPEPKYLPGDIIAEKPTNEDGLKAIISYDRDTDEYEIHYIYQNRDGSLGHFANDKTYWHGRESIEKHDPALIDHVDLSTVTIGDPKISPTPMPTPTPTLMTVYTDLKEIPYRKASGFLVKLVNHKNATDPTWDELMSFLESDGTDELPYGTDVPYLEWYICGDFAEILHNNAEWSNIKAAFVAVDFVEGEGHALNAFNTIDKGLVYVDCTGRSHSQIMEELIDNAEREDCENDRIAYVVIGKEYGVISIDKVTSPEQWFYAEYKQEWEYLKRDREAYNSDIAEYNKAVKAWERDVDAYKRAVGGRTYIRDPLEYESLDKMRNELKAGENELDIRKNELEARCIRLAERHEVLGYHRWESLGVVTNVDVFW